MKLTITIDGEFDITEEDIEALKEDFEDESRWYWKGSAVVIEVERNG